MKRSGYKRLTTKYCHYCDFTKMCFHKKTGCKNYKEYAKCNKRQRRHKIDCNSADEEVKDGSKG